MVVRAYGYANGQEVILTNTGGDRWETEVPFNEDGEYVVEFYAEDEAGNIGYMCTILFVVSGHQMHTYIVPWGVEVEQKQKEYALSPLFEKKTTELQRIYFRAEPKTTEYALSPQKGGYTIEHAICRDSGS